LPLVIFGEDKLIAFITLAGGQGVDLYEILIGGTELVPDCALMSSVAAKER